MFISSITISKGGLHPLLALLQVLLQLLSHWFIVATHSGSNMEEIVTGQSSWMSTTYHSILIEGLVLTQDCRISAIRAALTVLVPTRVALECNQWDNYKHGTKLFTQSVLSYLKTVWLYWDTVRQLKNVFSKIWLEILWLRFSLTALTSPVVMLLIILDGRFEFKVCMCIIYY